MNIKIMVILLIVSLGFAKTSRCKALLNTALINSTDTINPDDVKNMMSYRIDKNGNLITTGGGNMIITGSFSRDTIKH